MQQFLRVNEREERWRKERHRKWVEGDVLKASPGNCSVQSLVQRWEPEHSRSIHQHCAFAVHPLCTALDIFGNRVPDGRGERREKRLASGRETPMGLWDCPPTPSPARHFRSAFGTGARGTATCARYQHATAYFATIVRNSAARSGDVQRREGRGRACLAICCMWTCAWDSRMS